MAGWWCRGTGCEVVRDGDAGPMSVLFALLGALSQALTSVLQRLANISGSAEKKSGWQTTRFLIRHPLWLLGMLCLGGTFVFTALALYFGALATVQPILV